MLTAQRRATAALVAGPDNLVVESLNWLAPDAMLMSVVSLSGSREANDVFYLVLSWNSGWDGAPGSTPEGLNLAQVFLHTSEVTS